MKRKTQYITIAVVVVLAIALIFSSRLTGLGILKGGDLGICKDTDGGINYFEKGITTYQNRATEYVDYCYTKSAKWIWLNEYYCGETGRLTSKNYLCPNGCQDGACLK